MREIKLSSNKYPGLIALVDDEDYERVSQHTWYPLKRGNNFYAFTNISFRDSNGKSHHKMVRMHRFICLEIVGGIDHIDRNGLNNQKSNLREASQQVNKRNSSHKKISSNSSIYQGVYFNSRCNKWCSQIHEYNKLYHILHDSEELNAAYAYIMAYKHFHPEFHDYTPLPLDYIPSEELISKINKKILYIEQQIKKSLLFM